MLAPLIVGPARRCCAAAARALFAALTALGAVSFVDGWIVAGHGADRAYYGTDTRALEFLVGALLAVALAGRPLGRRTSRRRRDRRTVRAGRRWCGRTRTRASATEILFRGGLLAYAVLGCVLLLAACQPGPVRALCSTAPLRGLGRISYGVYVYHWPIFLWLTAARTGLGPLPLTLLRASPSPSRVAIVSFHLPRAADPRAARARPTRAAGSRSRPRARARSACAALVGALASAPAVTFAADRVAQLGARGVAARAGVGRRRRTAVADAGAAARAARPAA